MSSSTDARYASSTERPSPRNIPVTLIVIGQKDSLKAIITDDEEIIGDRYFVRVILQNGSETWLDVNSFGAIVPEVR